MNKIRKYRGVIEVNFNAGSLAEANQLVRLFANRVETGTPHGVNIDAYEAFEFKEAAKSGQFLKGTWCEIADKSCDFHSYPQDGQCTCGVFKHHVHCVHGGVIQVG